jgi:gliding motility-associated lipoprotein GldD
MNQLSAVRFCLLLFVIAFCSCSDDEPSYAPKPKGYPRLDLPAHTYQPLREVHPYTFEYSKSAVILPDTFAKAEPHWIFVAYPSLKASIQLTYKPVLNDQKRLSALVNDAYKLAAKHQIRASGMREQVIKTESGRTAVLLEIEGEVPSHFQFYTTDTTQHFLRGAVYLSTSDRQDSLAPVVEFLKKDALHLLKTLKWRE